MKRIIETHISERNITEFAFPLIPLAATAATAAARVAAPHVSRFVMNNLGGNLAKKVVTSTPAKLGSLSMVPSELSDMTDMAAGYEDPVAPDTYTKAASAKPSSPKPMQFHKSGMGENSSGGAVGSGAIASSMGNGRKIQSQLFAGETNEEGGNITSPPIITPSAGTGNITGAVSTSIRPQPRSAHIDDIARETKASRSSSINPQTGGTRGVVPISQQTNEVNGTSDAYLSFSRIINTTDEEDALNDIEVNIRRDRRLTHNEISDLQSSIHRKTDNFNEMTEDFGSSDWSIVIDMMNKDIEHYGGVTPESVEQAAEDAAEMYYDQMGYDSVEDAADRIVTMWLIRSGFGNLMDDVIEPTDMVNIPQDFETYINQFDEYAEGEYMLSWEETNGTDDDLNKAIKQGITPVELADSWAKHNGLLP